MLAQVPRLNGKDVAQVQTRSLVRVDLKRAHASMLHKCWRAARLGEQPSHENTPRIISSLDFQPHRLDTAAIL